MNMRGKVEITPDELIATLQKTSFPTVVVEGKDDVIVFRRLEELYADRFLTIMPAGGRDTVLRIFRERGAIPRAVKIAFVADQDTWVLSSIPQEYIDGCLLFTDGHSLENDAFRDGNFSSYMDGPEKTQFTKEVERFAFWYAHCVCCHLRGQNVEMKRHPNHVLDANPADSAMNGLTHDDEMKAVYKRVVADPARLLRGKALIGILMRQLNRPGRLATHHSRALLDSVGARPGEYIRRIFDDVGRATA
jgi:hypothetical protein